MITSTPATVIAAVVAVVVTPDNGDNAKKDNMICWSKVTNNSMHMLWSLLYILAL